MDHLFLTQKFLHHLRACPTFAMPSRTKPEPAVNNSASLPFDAVQCLRVFLLVLFWAAALLVAFRCRAFDAHSARLGSFLLLALLVSGTILLLHFLWKERWKPSLVLGPGLLFTVFLVLPSGHFSGIPAYLAIFLPTIGFLFAKSRPVRSPVVQSLETAEITEEENSEAFSESEWNENTQMRLLRQKDSNGAVSLESWVRADFQRGERVVNVHLPFGPGFERTPKLDVYQFEGTEVEIQISQLTPLGARFDLKRPTRRKSPESVGIYVALTE